MGSPTSEISYIAQSGPKEIDLSEAQNNFAVDSDHKEACSPIRFSYTAQGGGDFNPDWVTIDQASGSVVVEVGQLSQSTEFTIVISGNIKGDVDYDRANHQVKVIVTIPPQKQEEELVEEIEEVVVVAPEPFISGLQLSQQKEERESKQ